MVEKEKLENDVVARNGIVAVDPKPKNGVTSKVIDFVEKLIVKWMYDSSQPLHYLSGNFAPVPDETPPTKDLHVIGHLPDCLNGEFVRVGPNPKFAPVAGYHWFDGDGMIHGLRIKDGKATYVSRFVRTSRLKQEEFFGGAKFMKIGDLKGLFGLLMVNMQMLRAKLKVLDVSYGNGTANTALVYHHGKLLALSEADKPYAVKVLEDGDLQTLGMLDYDKRLQHSFTAHPKVDPYTGEMFTFGYAHTPPYITYRVISKDGFMHDPVPWNIENNDNGDVADDHYHRFLEDIEIMHSLGVNSYRFSISWPRILPKGRFGEVNPAGINFYNYLIDNLLLRGIEPFVTIYHHDFPQQIEDKYGSWLSPQMQKEFVHLAKTCFENFGDRVKYWATLNEPNLLTDMAYIRGTYPPTHCSAPFGNCSAGNSDTEPLIVLHNMLLSHAKAVKLYRKHFQEKQGGSMGIVLHSMMYEPLRDEDSDRQAVSRALAFNVGWMLDPLVFGDYPAEMREYLGSQLPRFSKEETKYVKGSLDFIGINHYSTLYAKDCIHSVCVLGSNHAIRGFVYTTGERDGIMIGEPTGNPRFFVVPEGMEKIVDYVKDRYKNIPMYVTENGYSPPKQKNQRSQDLVDDVKRIEYHSGYLSALARAIRNGADVRGYFIWSLMDNFEWLDGYSVMFGLYYIDRQTLERTPKLSATWFKNFLTDNTSHTIEKSSI